MDDDLGFDGLESDGEFTYEADDSDIDETDDYNVSSRSNARSATLERPVSRLDTHERTEDTSRPKSRGTRATETFNDAKMLDRLEFAYDERVGPSSPRSRPKEAAGPKSTRKVQRIV